MSLVELRIEQLAVFASAVVPFGDGFTALTGETGAGKSLCVAALRLALGERADTDQIRQGCPSGRVAAVFEGVPPSLRARLDELGVPADEFTTLSRELSRASRGACRINGALVSQSMLREAGEALAEVTLQGASHRLQQRSRQREILDLAAGAVEAREATAERVRAWHAARAGVEEVRRRRAAGADELRAAEATIDDLGRLDLRPGEDADLAAERLRLRNAAALAAAAAALQRAIAGDDTSPGAADLLAAGGEGIATVAGIAPELDSVGERAEALLEDLRDLGVAARRVVDSVALDEARLAVVEERLDALARVRRVHGSIEEALDALGEARALVALGTGGADRLHAAEAAEAEARRLAGTAALQLSDLRRAAARRLEGAVGLALHRLELPHARLRIVLERRPDPDGVEAGGATVHCGPAGIDEVSFLLAANRGADPRPLDAGPSGGELSRLVLALAACVTESGSPLLVLDEVDTGIGGETAARVGDLLAAAGRSRQVVAVTHRPEIASRADSHLLVSKADARGSVAATVRRVDGDERLGEIARLMSGRVTDAALARAVELRGEAVETISAHAAPARRRRRAQIA